LAQTVHSDEERQGFLAQLHAVRATQSSYIIGRTHSLREPPMPPLDPDVADLAPHGPALTAYDEEHAVTYMRMLDADQVGADWREVSRILLHIDPEHEPDRARRAFESHLARAKWAAREGYRQLLRGGALHSQ
jgi:hypothetical protein